MRGWAMVSILAACAEWRTVPATSLNHEPALVITTDRAYDLRDANADRGAVAGMVEHEWLASRCKFVDGEPLEIARECRWSVVPPDGATVALRAQDLQRVEARRGDGNSIIVGTLCVLAGGLFLVAVVSASGASFATD
jgi:hypothetical protein